MVGKYYERVIVSSDDGVATPTKTGLICRGGPPWPLRDLRRAGVKGDTTGNNESDRSA
jgi:hypothetical protein